MMARALRITGLVVLGVLVLLLALMSWALGTQSGTRFLWNTAASSVPGLSARDVEGRLAGAMDLRGLRFENESMVLDIGAIRLAWSPSSLLRGELRVDRLYVEDVVYVQRAAPPPADNKEERGGLPESLSLPLALDLRDIALRNAEYRPAPDADGLHLDTLMLTARWQGHDLSVSEFEATGPLFDVQSRLQAETQGDYPLSGSLDWRIMPPDFAAVAGTLSVEGDLQSLQVTQTLAAPYQSTQRVSVQDVLGDLALDADVALQDVRLAEVGASLPAVALSGTLAARGSLDALTLDAAVDADSDDFGEILLRLEGALAGESLTIQGLSVERPADGLGLELSGSADLAGSAPGLDVNGAWQKLRWPLDGDAQIESPRGEFSVSGHLDDYAIELDATLAVPGRGDGRLSLRGAGDDSALRLQRLQLALLDGQLEGEGDVRWSPDIRGQIRLDGRGLDPGILAADYPGQLTLALAASGAVTQAGVEADVDTLSLEGRLRGLPLALDLRGAYRESRLSLETLSLQSGSSRLSARGSAGKELDLVFSVDSDDLGDLLPGARGSLSGEGQIGGSLTLPAVRADIQASAMAYADYALQQLDLSMDVDPERDASSRLRLEIVDASLAGVEIGKASLRGDGSRDRHQLALRVDTSVGSASLDARGSLPDARWQGELLSGELQYAELAPWELEAPQTLQVDAKEQRLERGCWRSGGARLCLQGERSGVVVNAALALEAFSLDYIESFIPDSLALAGRIDAEASFRQRADEMPLIDAGISAQDVALRTGKTQERPDEVLLALETSRIQVRHDQTGLSAVLNLPFMGGGGVEGDLQIAQGSEPFAERPLGGSVALALDDLGFLGLLSPELDSASGALDGRFQLSGTVGEPRPEGQLSLSDGSLELAAPGLTIRDIAVRVASRDGSSFDFTGQARSGDGRLTLDGDAALEGEQTRLNLAITGENFEVANTVNARARVSPDLRVSMNDAGVSIRGEVRVPGAEITPRELPQSVVSASSDEVIVSDEAEDGVAAAQRELDARVRVVLGDAVTVDGFGLKGRLTGALTVIQSPGQPTLGSGELSIVGGEYRAYGQGLVIDTGKILFAGGPIDEPGLNIRASRRPAEGIVVGVSVRGPLQEPEFNVFSEPGMTQSEQLSWLVLGRPLDGASEGESNMIAQAALALGLKGGDFLAERLGGGLGVDTVGIETGSGEAGAASDVNQAAFVIGKYLSPDLFVSYGIGLFNSISTVKLEYSLSQHWKVSTESSTIASGGDVTYTIER
jgi:translocation and assembly module TamB